MAARLLRGGVSGARRSSSVWSGLRHEPRPDARERQGLRTVRYDIEGAERHRVGKTGDQPDGHLDGSDAEAGSDQGRPFEHAEHERIFSRQVAGRCHLPAADRRAQRQRRGVQHCDRALGGRRCHPDLDTLAGCIHGPPGARWRSESETQCGEDEAGGESHESVPRVLQRPTSGQT